MKYIIEIEDEPFVRLSALFGEDGLYRAKGFNSLVFDQFGLDKLTPLNDALDEAFQKGYNAAWVNVGECEDHVAKQACQKGLDDAWECAKRIVMTKTNANCPYFTVEELEKIFGCSTAQSVFYTHSASEAIEKVKAYEEQQKADKRIMFGDGLVTKAFGIKGIALSNEVNRCVYVWREDCVAYEASVDEWKKTGKTYPQVAELLKAMNDEQRYCSSCEHSSDPDGIRCRDCCGQDKWEPKEGAE